LSKAEYRKMRDGQRMLAGVPIPWQHSNWRERPLDSGQHPAREKGGTHTLDWISRCSAICRANPHNIVWQRGLPGASFFKHRQALHFPPGVSHGGRMTECQFNMSQSHMSDMATLWCSFCGRTTYFLLRGSLLTVSTISRVVVIHLNQH
jgi:hypothetical protein